MAGGNVCVCWSTQMADVKESTVGFQVPYAKRVKPASCWSCCSADDDYEAVADKYMGILISDPNYLNNLCDPGAIVIAAKFVMVEIYYPMVREAKLRVTADTPRGVTRLRLATAIVAKYQRMWREEQKSIAEAVEKDTNEDGKYGFWPFPKYKDLVLHSVERSRDGIYHARVS